MLLDILYQDEYIVAVNKPSGLLVHRSWIDKDETIFALQLVRDQIGQYVYPIHRLDKPTSGVLIFALDKDSARVMSEMFVNHNIKKEYLAVVRGYTKEDTIDYALSVILDKIADKGAKEDKEDQEASTHYKCLATLELPYPVSRYPVARYSLVHLIPTTGRKHQLRRHMKHIMHPIVGDTKYGRGEHNRLFREKFTIKQLLLTAFKISFIHPYTKKEIVIQAQPDEAFETMFKLFKFSY
jgi:tRNA pseudouridine65 synthase